LKHTTHIGNSACIPSTQSSYFLCF